MEEYCDDAPEFCPCCLAKRLRRINLLLIVCSLGNVATVAIACWIRFHA